MKRQPAGQLVAVERAVGPGSPLREVEELGHLKQVVHHHRHRLGEARPGADAGPVLVEELGALGGGERAAVGARAVDVEEGVHAGLARSRRAGAGKQLGQGRGELQRHVLGGEHELLGSAGTDVVVRRLGGEAGDGLAHGARVLGAGSEAAIEQHGDRVLVLERGESPGIGHRRIDPVVTDVAPIIGLRRRLSRWPTTRRSGGTRTSGPTDDRAVAGCQ
jgi:hypothetical protein